MESAGFLWGKEDTEHTGLKIFLIVIKFLRLVKGVAGAVVKPAVSVLDIASDTSNAVKDFTRKLMVSHKVTRFCWILLCIFYIICNTVARKGLSQTASSSVWA